MENYQAKVEYLEKVNRFMYWTNMISQLGNECERLLAFELLMFAERHILEGKIDVILDKVKPVVMQVQERFGLDKNSDLLSNEQLFRYWITRRDLAFSICDVLPFEDYLPATDIVQQLKDELRQ